jgi:RNA polymerase sigma-70 factor (ECF subfamily)
LFWNNPEKRFHRVVSVHLDAAYGLACWLLGDPNDAEDAVQDAAVRAYRAIGGYRGGDGKAWFLAIVRNTCMNSIRTKSMRRETDVDDEQLTGFVDSSPDPEERLLQSLDAARCRRAIETLSAPLREVLVLREIEEMGYQEIAEVIGCPVGTVMSRLARARARLIEILKSEEAR